MPEVGITTLSFHPWDMACGTPASELVPDDRSKVLPQTPGRGPFQLGVPAPKTAQKPLPGEAELGGWRRGTVQHPQLGPPSILSLSLGWWASSQPALSVASSRASSVPPEAGLRRGLSQPGLAARAEATGRVAAGSGGRDPVQGWLVWRGPHTDDAISAWWAAELGVT